MRCWESSTSSHKSQAQWGEPEIKTSAHSFADQRPAEAENREGNLFVPNT